MATLSSVARCAASPTNARDGAGVRQRLMRSNVTDSEFWSQPGVPGWTCFEQAHLFANAREYLLVPRSAEAVTAQVSVPSLS